MSMTLHLQTVPARNGILWIRHAWRVFKRRPFALMGLFAIFMVVASLLAFLGEIGSLLMLAALPLLSLAFMLATHLVLQDKTPTWSVFAAPLQLTAERRRTQLVLGSSYALLTLLAFVVANWLDGGAFMQFLKLLGTSPVDEKALAAQMAEPSLFWGSVLRLGLAALLSVPYWHAPALVHWGGQGALQALFSSTLGVWRNRNAFALNALAWGGLAILLSVVPAVLLSGLGLAPLLPLLAMPLGLLLSALFYTSLYFTFVDCFMFGAPRDLLDESKR